MNLLVKRALTFAAPAAVGAAGATGVATLQSSHSQLTVQRGDTIVLSNAIRTDTVLRVTAAGVFAAKCGQGQLHRLVKRRGVLVLADTQDVTVACAATPPAVASVFVCISPVDSLRKYDLIKTDSLGRSLSLDARGDSLVRSWGCIDSITVDTLGRPLAPQRRVSSIAPWLGRDPPAH